MKVAILCAGPPDIVHRLVDIYRNADPAIYILEHQDLDLDGDVRILSTPYFSDDSITEQFDICAFPIGQYNGNLVKVAGTIAMRYEAVDVHARRTVALAEGGPVVPIPITLNPAFSGHIRDIRDTLMDSAPPPPGDFSADGFVRETPVQVERAAIYGAAIERFRGRTVTDYGCGLGWGTELIARFCPGSRGVDINADIVAYNSKTFPTAEFFTEPTPPWQAATMVEMLEHVEDPGLFLAQTVEDFLFLSVPNPRVYPLRGDLCPQHIHDLEPHDVEHLLREAGYTPEFIGYPTVRKNECGPTWEPADFGISRNHDEYSGPSALFFAERK